MSDTWVTIYKNVFRVSLTYVGLLGVKYRYHIQHIKVVRPFLWGGGGGGETY